MKKPVQMVSPDKTTKTYEIILQPGDPLPSGVFVSAWKLQSSYGPGAISLMYKVEKDK